ncbi:hypothetical protein TSUD_275780 [Trifolium subterraneum]|uniref:Replication factor A C-terminal domain-containing protein n=1 Tax=Trifolium subterraneum TaxID=3900 RepID=A0A2Z6NBZ4_TRISU|nr:hypothetical protein TSUD_275780 [Trifolium subterraneum]
MSASRIRSSSRVGHGIDMHTTDNTPRFFLEIKIGDELDEIDFVLHDEVVSNIAPFTCIKMQEEGGCTSLYPDELEHFFGDPILFKVRKDYGCDSCGGITVEVLDILFDSSLMDIYHNPAHILYADNAFIGNLEIKRLSDLGNSKDDSPAIVIGWYDSVFEGIDMWYSDEDRSRQPRFRLKINVCDEITQTIFALFDEEVKKLAFETCGVLASIVVSKKVLDVGAASQVYEIVDDRSLHFG